MLSDFVLGKGEEIIQKIQEKISRLVNNPKRAFQPYWIRL
jgi:hypothetical protein